MAVESTLRRRKLGLFVVHVRRFAPDSLPAVTLATPESEAEHQLEAMADAPWLAPSLAELTRSVIESRIRPLRLLLNAAHPLIDTLRSSAGQGSDLEDVYVGIALGALLQSRKLLTDRNAPVLHRHLTDLSVLRTRRGPPLGRAPRNQAAWRQVYR
jgi:hypothetical protein